MELVNKCLQVHDFVDKEHPRDQQNVVLIHKWSLFAGSKHSKYISEHLQNVVFISRWSL